VPSASGPVILFCTVGLILGGIEGVGSSLHVLRFQTRFGRYRGRRVPFSCFLLPYSFATITWAPSPVLIFYAAELVLRGIKGVGAQIHILRSRTRFHVLRFRTRFQRYRGCRVPFSCFRSRTHFRRYHGRRDPVSCFVLCDSIWAVPRASSPVFIFYAPNPFWAVPRVSVPNSCFALPDTFLAIPRSSGLVFMFCAPRLVSGCTERVGSRFHVLRYQTRFGRNRGCRV
jgi:hypothetical protein